MSFGVAVGDVIAVRELCWKLYRNVYQVSRHAPAELKALGNELNSLKGILDILKEEKINPDSAINQSGQGRLDLFNKVLSQTGETLNQIEELSNKYKILKRPRNAQSQRGYFKIQWDKLRYAKELHSINDLRAKLHYHEGQLNLLLLLTQDSSLERIQRQTARTEEIIDEIRTFLIPRTPLEMKIATEKSFKDHE